MRFVTRAVRTNKKPEDRANLFTARTDVDDVCRNYYVRMPVLGVRARRRRRRRHSRTSRVCVSMVCVSALAINIYRTSYYSLSNF